MAHHRDAVIASNGGLGIRKQIYFALVWEANIMMMALYHNWLVLAVMYALHVGGDEENFHRRGGVVVRASASQSVDLGFIP